MIPLRNQFIWLFWVLGFSLVVASWGSSLLGVHGLLVVVSPVAEYRPSSGHASVVVAPGLEGTDSVIVAHGVGCLTTCGIFPNQGGKPYLLRWQAHFLPVRHQGSPGFLF